MSVQPNMLPYLISIPIILLVLVFRMRSLSQTRRLRVEWLWVTPTILIALTVLTFMQAPPAGNDWLWLGVALAVGGAFGWYRGKMMQISVDPETHVVNTRASAGAMIFIVLILVARMGLRYVAVGQAQTLHLSLTLISGLFLVFAVGLLGVQRVEMFLRAQRLLGEARASRAGAAQTS
jgi:hypothetical protein